MSLIKEILKKLDKISFNASITKDYSREMHLDPDK